MTRPTSFGTVELRLRLASSAVTEPRESGSSGRNAEAQRRRGRGGSVCFCSSASLCDLRASAFQFSIEYLAEFGQVALDCREFVLQLHHAGLFGVDHFRLGLGDEALVGELGFEALHG